MAGTEILLNVQNYDLAATLDSGQVFRWQQERGRPAREFQLLPHEGEPPILLNSWVGVIGKRPVRLTQVSIGIHAETATPVEDWGWLREFLQTDIDMAAILETFPDDEPMCAAVNACKGLRVLRQDPWECLASFILSSNKQIVHIRQIIALLCERFGELLGQCSVEPVARLGSATGRTPQFSFPTPQRIAATSESKLRACKMGFRAPYLLATARQIADGRFDPDRPRHLPFAEARAELMKLPGVGGKIADCVLLFGYGFGEAFPVDVWVERALRQLYFPRRRVTPRRLRHFAATHFGPFAGFAQQYLFHFMRTKVV